MEDRFFFESGGAHCYAVLHMPDGEPADARPRWGVVLCHPLLDFDLYEVPWTIRMVTGYARELAAAGVPALRFDFRGAGQSDGEFEELTLGTCVQDLQRAVDVLVERTGVEEVVLNGTRLGATVAMRVGARDARVRRLVLWDPVPDPHGNLQAVFRRVRASLLAMGRSPDAPLGPGPMLGDGAGAAFTGMLPGQNRLDAGGYVIGPAFLEEIKTWKTDADVRGFRGQVLLLQLIRGWSGAGGLRRALIQLDEAYRAAGAESQLIEAMDVHPAEWFKQPDYFPVYEITSRWLGLAAAVKR